MGIEITRDPETGVQIVAMVDHLSNQPLDKEAREADQAARRLQSD